jgi:hypothetical protein
MCHQLTTTLRSVKAGAVAGCGADPPDAGVGCDAVGAEGVVDVHAGMSSAVSTAKMVSFSLMLFIRTPPSLDICSFFGRQR